MRYKLHFFFFSFFLFICWYLIVPVLFVEKIIFSPLSCFWIFVKNQLIIYMCGSISWLLCSVALFIYLYTNTSLYWLLYPVDLNWGDFVPQGHLALYGNTFGYQNWERGTNCIFSVSLLILFLFFKVGLTTLGPLHFKINFRISISVSPKILLSFCLRLC